MRPIRSTRAAATAVALLSLAVATTGRAQTRAARAAAQPLAPIVVTAAAPEPDDPFALDDALLDGIAIAEWQAQRIGALRHLQLTEAAATRRQLGDAVAAMHRATDRGDGATARAILALLQSTAAQTQTFRLASLRALLTPDQLGRFDANVDALMRRDDRAERPPR